MRVYVRITGYIDKEQHLKIKLWMEVLQGKRTRGKETATETQKPSLNNRVRIRFESKPHERHLITSMRREGGKAVRILPAKST